MKSKTSNRYELLAMVTAGGFVACAIYWSHVLLGPMLVSAIGVSFISWLLPLLFPLVLGGLVYLTHRLIKAGGGKGLNALLTKHPMIMAALGTGFGFALTTSMALGSAGLAFGGLWIPVVMVAGVYCLAQLAYSGWRWSLGGELTQAQLESAKAAKTMLLIGSAFNLMAYYSAMFIAPAVVAWTGSAAMVWVVPILFPLVLAMLPVVLNVERLYRYTKKSNVQHLKQLKLNPHYTGMVIMGTLMPFAMSSAKMLTPIVMSSLGASVALGLSIVMPAVLAVVAVGLTYVIYKHLQVKWDGDIENAEKDVDIGSGVGLGVVDALDKPAHKPLVLDPSIEEGVTEPAPRFLLNS